MKNQFCLSMLVACGLAACGMFVALEAGAQDATEVQAEANGEIEEVLVTARKREESLLEIPESVVAVSGDDIDRQGLKGLEDIGSRCPT